LLLQASIDKLLTQDNDREISLDNFEQNIPRVKTDPNISEITSNFNKLDITNIDGESLQYQTADEDSTALAFHSALDDTLLSTDKSYARGDNKTLPIIREIKPKSIIEERRPEGILVIAPKECGKSFLLNRLEKRYPSVLCASNDKKISATFKAANRKAPCLLLIDNIDRRKNMREISSLISQLKTNILVIATASAESNVAAELRAPGKLSVNIHINKPDDKCRETILCVLIYELKLSVTENVFMTLLEATHGCTPYECMQLVNKMTMLDDITEQAVRNIVGEHRTLQVWQYFINYWSEE